MKNIKIQNTSFYDLSQNICVTSNGLRVTKIIHAFFEGNVSNKTILGWIKNQKVKVNNSIVTKNALITYMDDVVSINIEGTQTEEINNTEPINVVYEDDYILVLNKQDGIVSHHGINNNHALTDMLNLHDDNLSSLPRSGLINRLDKNTTGLMVVGKSVEAILDLQKQFKDSTAKRTYLALVHYKMSTQAGKIKTFLRQCKKTMSIKVSNAGYEAITYYQVVQHFTNYTLVQCVLETGRTHQIRVHFRHLHHYIVGDKKYTHIKTNVINRQALHSHMLNIIHPFTKTAMQFTCDLPADFQNLLNTLETNHDAFLH